MHLRPLTLLLAGALLGCQGEPTRERVADEDDDGALPAVVVPDVGPVAPVSVASMDRATDPQATSNPSAPVEARVLVLCADGKEPELGAIRSVLGHRGVPYDVFVATQEAALTAARLRSGERGLYQATILTTSSLALSGTSMLSATEWAVLADYEQAFGVRRAVLAAWPDPALGFGSATQRNTSSSPVAIDCTAPGEGVFRDVNCDRAQEIHGDTAYLARPTSTAVTALLADGGGNALAALRTGSDGRASLMLMFRNHADRLHSQQFLHGVLGWVTGGTYLGERRLDMGVQVDDLFYASSIWTGGTYRLTGGDLRAALAWVNQRRALPSTPDFRLSLAFNGDGADDGDALTAEAVAESGQWFWINHTFRHAKLDDISYADALEEYALNIQLAGDLPLRDFDVRNLVTGNVSGLVNPDAMQAARDAGIRQAVTDTSADGCDNPSPNTTFYDVIEPSILLVPRRPGGMPYNVSTPSQWVARTNDGGGNATYDGIVADLSDTLLRYLIRGEADPWMYHQANLRAYDGVHSMLGDVMDAVIARVEERLRVPVRTLSMEETALRFARRLDVDTAGVRATLYRGRALVIDAARAVSVPVTGVRPDDGEPYGGDVIGLVDVVPGTSTCVPLDSAGAGCNPPPVRQGGPGPATALPTGYCNASSLPQTPNVQTAIARGSVWRYWDRGGLTSTSWRGSSFDDSTWASGAGPLGYGEDYVDTTVSYGPSGSSKYLTTYFRRSFSLANPAAVTALRGEVMYDDGVVVYLNGTEIQRAAMPTGTVSSTTLASSHEAGNSYQTFDWTARRNLLVAGTNTIVVEVHQASASSSDLAFDLALLVEGTASLPPPPPPTLTGGVPRNAQWWYWDNGGTPASSWRTQSSGQAGWESGPGAFGYGESYLDTTVSSGPDPANKYVTTYFTITTRVDDPSAVGSMIGEVMYDDGFVAYLNGTEIARQGLPGGSVAATTLSSSHEASNRYETFDWTARKGLLRAGDNVLAVEVHQASPSSGDLVFDMALLLGDASEPPPAATEDIAPRSTWRYWDGRSAPSTGSTWATPSFDDAAWRTGAGPLGYGETYIATPLSYGADASTKPVTAYFRRSFSVSTVDATIIGKVMYDDGVVVHLNGHEIARLAMPTGAIGPTTLSTGHETGNRYETYDWSSFRSYLVPGMNVLAVEVHQASPSSSDLTFDLALDVTP
jgi:hypothetical protein